MNTHAVVRHPHPKAPQRGPASSITRTFPNVDEHGVKNEIVGYDPKELGNDEFPARRSRLRGYMWRGLVCPSDTAGRGEQGPHPCQAFGERHLGSGLLLAHFSELGLVVEEEDVVIWGGDEVDEYFGER